ncbi:Scr1 family TA system antitoxin-like transcriptional regulator [Amycolatopsis japonica]|uniref:Scr1 family TA system antitoxin-like transcriptional regulator n=1 Tax=Amycolatopsis japonica TaxID=208439 RepID=UPI0033CA5B29
MLDSGCRSVTAYASVEIPRQLQIEPYIREALARNGHVDGPALDTAVRTRLASQAAPLRTLGPFTFYCTKPRCSHALKNPSLTRAGTAPADHVVTTSPPPPRTRALCPSQPPCRFRLVSTRPAPSAHSSPTAQRAGDVEPQLLDSGHVSKLQWPLDRVRSSSDSLETLVEATSAISRTASRSRWRSSSNLSAGTY